MPSTRGARLSAALAAPLTLVLLASCTQPSEQVDAEDLDRLSIATGTTAGAYFPVGGAIGEIIGNEVEDVDASTEATAASVENLRLIDQGESEIGIVQGDAAYQALHGEGEDFEDDPLDVQALTVLYPNVYQAVSLESIHDDLELDCFSDVEGHRFSLGAPGSGNELATNLVFDGLDMDVDSDIDAQHLAYAETADALREGQLDAGSWVIGEGHASLNELEATDPIHLIEMCADERDEIIADHPFYDEHTIEGGTYETVEDDVETMALWNVLVVSADFPAELAEEIVDAMYANIEDVTAVYEPGEPYFEAETMLESPIPLHEGTINYAEANDMDVPEDLRP